MSDPNREGPYECHGLMSSLTAPGASSPYGFLCPECGTTRAAYGPRDPRRAEAERLLEAAVVALMIGARGDVE